MGHTKAWLSTLFLPNKSRWWLLLRNEVSIGSPMTTGRREYLRIIKVSSKTDEICRIWSASSRFTLMHEESPSWMYSMVETMFVVLELSLRTNWIRFKGTVNHFWYLLHGARYGVEDAGELASIAWRAVWPRSWYCTAWYCIDFTFSTVAPGMTQMILPDMTRSSSDLRWFSSVLHTSTQLTWPQGITAMFSDSVSDVTAPNIYTMPINGSMSVLGSVVRWQITRSSKRHQPIDS